jgi:flagellar motor switch protein FliN/FliY
MAEEPLVSDDEMKDILRGFGSDAAEMTSDSGAPRENYDVILDIELTATARLGSIEMPISEILNLGPGSIIEVGQFVDEPIELLVNDKLVARGDVVVVDEKFGLRITEIVSQKERIESLR